MSAPTLGEIMMFAGNFPPVGFAFCDGRVLPIDQNTALFSLLGTTYGGDGVQTFSLPDLRGRAPIHQGQGPGLPNYSIGTPAGAEQVSLASNNVPAHLHGVQCTNNTGTKDVPTGLIWATDSSGATAEYDTQTGVALASSAIGNSGNATPTPHNNIQPSLAISFCIALNGIFPARN